MRVMHTYALLEVKQATFDDVKSRVEAAGPDYKELLDTSDGKPVVILGHIALVAEDEQVAAS